MVYTPPPSYPAVLCDKLHSSSTAVLPSKLLAPPNSSAAHDVTLQRRACSTASVANQAPPDAAMSLVNVVFSSTDGVPLDGSPTRATPPPYNPADE